MNIESEIGFVTVDQIVLAVYTFDILVQFLTSYINIQTGDEINKPSYIANRYIRGEFIVDFLSTFPFGNFSLYDTNISYRIFASICQLLKTLRLRKLYIVIAKSNQTV